MPECFSYKYSWLCHPITHSIPTGIVKLDKKNRIVDIVERRKGAKPPFISAGGVMLVDTKLFDYKPYRHGNGGEYYVTSMIGKFLKRYPMHAVMGREDLYFTSPEDLDRNTKK
jgi:hypothetical protein